MPRANQSWRIKVFLGLVFVLFRSKKYNFESLTFPTLVEHLSLNQVWILTTYLSKDSLLHHSFHYLINSVISITWSISLIKLSVLLISALRKITILLLNSNIKISLIHMRKVAKQLARIFQVYQPWYHDQQKEHF